MPNGNGLDDYDGVAITGSALNVYDGSGEVERQIDLARAVYASGTSFFGSCWGLQVAAVASGGTVIKNPVGREIGIARNIALTELATILERRTKLLVAEGFFADEAEGKAYCADLRALDADRARRDIAFRLGVEPELLETERRVTELRNWIEHQVRPQKSRRGRG